MTTHIPFEGIPTGASTPTRADVIKEENKKSEKFFKTKTGRITLGAIGGIGLASVATVASIAAGIMSDKDGGTAPAPGTTNSAEPFPSQEPTAEAEPSNEKPNEYWVSPEEIAAMSPEELQDFATITVEEAPELEDFAKEFTEVLQARLNAGGTAEEYAPYKDAAKGVYEDAMSDKYDPAFDAGVFPEGYISEGLRDLHKSAMNSNGSSFGLEDKIRYSMIVDLKDSETVEEKDTDENFTMNINVHIQDNYTDLQISEYVFKPNIDDLIAYTIKGQVQNGIYKIIEITAVKQ